MTPPMAWLKILTALFGRNPTIGEPMRDSTRAWWKDAGERLGWTFIQGAIAILTADQLGWIDLVDGDIWKAAAAGGLGSSLAFIKALASTRLSAGGTAQLGMRTYSYTEQGPGSAGGDA